MLAASAIHRIEKECCLAELLGAIYRLHAKLAENPDALSRFYVERDIQIAEDGEIRHLATVKAVLLHRNRKYSRSLLTAYAQAIFVMERNRVDPAGAVQWLNTGSGKGRGGTVLGKTKALWSKTPEGQAAKAKYAAKSLRWAKKVVEEAAAKGASAGMPFISTTAASKPMKRPGIVLVELDAEGEPPMRAVLTEDLTTAAKAILACG
ncbi:hypothetical protein J2X36_004548 [Methylobacterium sp. BE186]|uniref:hypothetical protein n=1 Tax=Methylobacterium sp. BE186 TaxID=2817715 RepID=UPI0028644C91|nr:hypothetical protein [Methylobacterium sp. BE186]MDR7039770.1 hypothetical protein [Methylobacterium sp. BE186]